MIAEAKDIDEYIAGFPTEIQKLLEQLRATIKKIAPDAEEVISYAMPAFKFKGALVYFAAYKNHIPLTPEDVAETIFYCANLPAHVCINDLSITCLQQADAVYFYKENFVE